MSLLKVYSLPFAIAILLHTFVALFLATGFGLFNLLESDESITPFVMQARLIVKEKKPKPTQIAPQAIETQASDAEDEQNEPEDGIDDMTQEELDRIQRFEELQQSMLADDIGREIHELESSIIDDEIALFVRGIYESVVQSWSRPPSATNEMEARLLVELYPNGDLISVGIVQSSGNEAFDRSATAAVRKAVPFQLPSDANLYNKRFRSFYLFFKPTDLTR
ncbi:MAG: cell envelope integrity protein TolA [Gammaproteobacteria bacterium]|nr:cell envelope integrity protein TolA [Gammaproteobacteria bacterium]